jgi:hypothetical protein
VILEAATTYASDFILDNPNGKLNDGKSSPIGKWAKFTLQKSIIEKSRRKVVTYPIKFGKKPSGVWVEYEIIELMKAFELLKKAGAWFSIEPNILQELKDKNLPIKEQFQGEANVRLFLEENPTTTEYLFNKFKDILSTK